MYKKLNKGGKQASFKLKNGDESFSLKRGEKK